MSSIAIGIPTTMTIGMGLGLDYSDSIAAMCLLIKCLEVLTTIFLSGFPGELRW